MSTAAQNFNVDLLFLYGTVERQVAFTTRDATTLASWTPAFDEGYTDWNRRVLELPQISKGVENWTGKFESAEVTLRMADTDGSVSGTLYGTITGGYAGQVGTGSPFGTKVAIYSKVSENPTQWRPVFEGNITSVERESGITSVILSDNFRNLYNSKFYPDYAGIATFINGSLYGTVKDVIGTNIYFDDRGYLQLITVKREESGGFWSDIAGVVFGGVIGFAAGGPWGAALGGAAGVMQIGGGQSGPKSRSYYHVTDYNAIPDDTVLGGQPLKFSVATVDGRGVDSPLFSSPSYRIRGGTFTNGIYGTVEIDDLLHGVGIGNYIYAASPLLYFGSPDDIIVRMLTGSNVTARYQYPKDFSEDWAAQTSALKNIEAYFYIENFDDGGVAEALDSLAREFGFTFFLNERNKFAVRTIRRNNVSATSVIGTLSEGYNIIGNGVKRIDDIKTSYTNLNLKYKDTWIGDLYDQELNAEFPAATYYGGQLRVLEVNSKWIHDSITAQFIATRFKRRYANVVPRVSFQTSLYSVPVSLSEIVSVTGWGVGTSVPYEITRYTKNFQESIAEIEAEDANYFYSRRGFFNVGEGAFGTMLSTATLTPVGSWGFVVSSVNSGATNSFFAQLGPVTGGPWTLFVAGDLLRIGTRTEEVMKVLDVTGYDLFGERYVEYRVERGFGFTQPAPKYSVGEYLFPTGTPTATSFNISTENGTIWRWF